MYITLDNEFVLTVTLDDKGEKRLIIIVRLECFAFHMTKLVW